MSQPTCTGTRRDGQPCAAPRLPESTFCFAHDPANAERARAARAKGGANASKARSLKRRRHDLKTADGVMCFGEELIWKTYEGKISPDIARTLGYLMTGQRESVKECDLEQRLEAIEQRLASQGDDRRWA